jgi:hypothetical protein
LQVEGNRSLQSKLSSEYVGDDCHDLKEIIPRISAPVNGNGLSIDSRP